MPHRPTRRRRTAESPRIATLVLLAAVAATSGCCIDPVNGDRYFCLGEMTDAEEAELGRSYAPNFIAQSGGIYRDAELHAYLDGIVVGKLAKVSHRPGLPWEFHILNTSQINAFALPGGQVFVTRGLLTQLDTEAQFAHLMGHEVGHVAHKHSSRGQGRQALFGILVGVVTEVESRATDGDGLAIASTAVGVAGQLTLLHYSRGQELESDERGVDYALRAGYDPREGKKTFETFLRLKQSSGRGESRIAGLLSTHPLDSTRIAALDGYIAREVPDLGSRTLVVDRPGWDAQLARLRAAQPSYDEHDAAIALLVRHRESGEARLLDEAEAKLRAAAARLPGEASFPLGLAHVEIARGRPSAALAHLDRALQLDGEEYGARFTRGEVRLGEGDAAGAREDLTVAARLYPLSPHPRLLLGAAAERLGDREGASRSYREALERAEPGSEPHRRASEKLATPGG
jgi:predicted Zn-dependent protease